MENKQTAVEYIYEMLEGMIPRTILYSSDKKRYFQQALKMEKEQIIDAFATAVLKVNSDYTGMHEETSASIYYNETYGNLPKD